MSALFPQVARSAAPVASTSRSFATSTPLLAAAKKAAPRGPAKKTRQGGYNKNKGTRTGGGRVHVSGVTLRTPLAKEQADLTDLVKLYPESVIPLNASKPSVFPRNTYDQLRTFGLPRKIDKELAVGAPASVIRQVTLDMARTLDGANARSSKDSRFILTGDRGSGKSMLLLQAVSYAIESGWIVLYTPEAHKLIDSSTSFAYNSSTQIFDQPALASSLLHKLMTVNRDRLASIKLTQNVELVGQKFEAGSSLDALVALGAKDERAAVSALDATFAILGQQTQYPVLLAVDQVQTLFRRSLYRAPDYSTLESYHLSTPRLALDYLSGRKTFKRGAILAALSQGLPLHMPSSELLVGLNMPTRTPVNAYTRLDEHHLAHAKSGLQRIDVPFGMSGTEAAAMFELWTRKGWATNPSDEVFMGGFAAAGGNPRELGQGWSLTHQSFIV